MNNMKELGKHSWEEATLPNTFIWSSVTGKTPLWWDNQNNGCLEGGIIWLGKAGRIVQGRWKESLSGQQCELQRGARLPKSNDPGKLHLYTCMYIIPQENFFMLECFMYFFWKGNIKKLFLCSLTCAPCRVETSGILWCVTRGSTSMFTRGSDVGDMEWDTNTATPYINATKAKRAFYS